jgi:hypothetical protein
LARPKAKREPCAKTLTGKKIVLALGRANDLHMRHFVGIAKRYNYTYRDAYWAISWMFVHYPSVDELDHQLPAPVAELNNQNVYVPLWMPIPH